MNGLNVLISKQELQWNLNDDAFHAMAPSLGNGFLSRPLSTNRACEERRGSGPLASEDGPICEARLGSETLNWLAKMRPK